MCGYQSANSFCIAFKRVTGMSSKKFREKTPVLGLTYGLAPKSKLGQK